MHGPLLPLLIYRFPLSQADAYQKKEKNTLAETFMLTWMQVAERMQRKAKVEFLLD